MAVQKYDGTSGISDFHFLYKTASGKNLVEDQRNMKKVVTLFAFILFLTCLVASQPALCAEAQFQDSLSLLKEKRYDEAIKALSKDISKAYNNRGYAWHLKGDYNRAVVDFTKTQAIAATRI